jgi:hypothetical protein
VDSLESAGIRYSAIVGWRPHRQPHPCRSDMRIATRQHTNGWLAVVEERRDGDQLVGYALAPDGTTHHSLPTLVLGGTRSAYDVRKVRAQLTADQLVATMSAHDECAECEPWSSRWR